MDTQPRAEDEQSPQQEMLSQEQTALEESQADTIEQDLAAAEAKLDTAEEGAIALPEEIGAAAVSDPDASEGELEATATEDEEPIAVSTADEDTAGTDEVPAMELEEPAIEAELDEPPLEASVQPELSPSEITAIEQPVETAVLEQEAAAGTEAPTAIAEGISETEFAQMVDDALETVGGILLFKMRVDEDGEEKHVAATSIGDGARRQYLLLSLPVAGGKLKVESAARSNSPVAKLAEAYVGVVEAFCAAA
ncbi:hypothetical protein PV773_02105 [Mesorhizobium sp. CC13]|uniref:hypothetical protein n=1 Tax=Mesorhizobium sp. CC13 TaxID=3029194 RepID=UPI00326786F1